MKRYADDSSYLAGDSVPPAMEQLLEPPYLEVAVRREAPGVDAHRRVLPMMCVATDDSEDCDADEWPLAVGEAASLH